LHVLISSLCLTPFTVPDCANRMLYLIRGLGMSGSNGFDLVCRVYGGCTSPEGVSNNDLRPWAYPGRMLACRCESALWCTLACVLHAILFISMEMCMAVCSTNRMARTHLRLFSCPLNKAGGEHFKCGRTSWGTWRVSMPLVVSRWLWQVFGSSAGTGYSFVQFVVRTTLWLLRRTPKHDTDLVR
jgi:hypothetical protein